MKNLAVTMYHFPGVNEAIFDRNYQSFVDTNPDAYIARIEPSDFLIPRLRAMVNIPWLCWRNSDLVLYDLYLRKPNYEWYFYGEWDMFCNIELRKMIEPVMNFRVATRRVLEPDRNVSKWFRSNHKVLGQYHPWQCATAPLAGTLLHASVLDKIVRCERLLNTNLFCEVRLGTLARMHGFEIAAYPLYGHSLWYPDGLTPENVKEEGVWHRVKFLVP